MSAGGTFGRGARLPMTSVDMRELPSNLIHPPRPRRLPTARATAVLVLALASSLTTGCAVGITHKREVEARTRIAGFMLSPDSGSVAVGVEVDLVHEPNALGMFPDGGVLLYKKRTLAVLVCDLARVASLRTIATIPRRADEQFGLSYWDSTGIVFLGAARSAHRLIRVDPASGRWTRLPDAELPMARARYYKFHPGGSAWGELQRRHVYERYDQFFLWHPETRHAEYLFDLPAVWDGHRERRPSQAADARRESIRDGLLDVHDASVHQESDSVRVTLETYSPRPEVLARTYELTIVLNVPDTIAIRRNLYQGEQLAMGAEPRLLLPSTQRVDAVVAYADLRRTLRPYARYLSEWPPDSVEVTLSVRLHPRPLPADSSLLPLAQYHAGGQDVVVDVPSIGLVAPKRWRGRRPPREHVP